MHALFQQYMPLVKMIRILRW